MMNTRTRVSFRAGAAAALAGVVLIVAGCGGGSSSSTTSSAAASASASATSSRAPTTGVSIRTAKGSAGTYLTGPSGRALYLWVADSNGKSNCSGACASAWPPLIASTTPIAAAGVTSADIGSITRSNGVKQVTYKGHPLYYFIGDPSAGTTKGEGNDGFGAKWWLVTPSGTAIVGAGSASSSSAGASSSGAPSYGY
jgi:predicted lipoprotein with Yx(FWY)xxD motif